MVGDLGGLQVGEGWDGSMKVLKLQIELHYDQDKMHGDDADGRDWFRDVLTEDKLHLHSWDAGDFIGEVKVKRIEGLE